MENTAFRYAYSTARNKEVESIRNKYCLVRKAGSKGSKNQTCESICVGIKGALVFGTYKNKGVRNERY